MHGCISRLWREWRQSVLLCHWSYSKRSDIILWYGWYSFCRLSRVNKGPPESTQKGTLLTSSDNREERARKRTILLFPTYHHIFYSDSPFTSLFICKGWKIVPGTKKWKALLRMHSQRLNQSYCFSFVTVKMWPHIVQTAILEWLKNTNIKLRLPMAKKSPTRRDLV